MTARVLLLTTNLARGGAETQVARLAAGLRARGWNTAVLSLVKPTAFEQELASAGVPVFIPEMRPGPVDLRALARFARIVRDFRPEILHAHMFHANLLARVCRLVFPVPHVVSTIHSLADSSRHSDDTRLRDRLYGFTDALSDTTVAVCQAAAARYTAARAIQPSRLRVIANGVDTNAFRPEAACRTRMRASLGIDGQFTWLAVGRLMWKKDYRTMLEAWARLGQGLLLIAGAGPEEDALRALAGSRVRFLGLREDVAALMNAADALVCSSVVEGLPMVLIEAAASALPAVATDVGGVREVVLDGATGWVVPPRDPVRLAEAMRRTMQTHPEERLSMGRAARQHALARFAMDRVLDEWERLYRELLAGGARP